MLKNFSINNLNLQELIKKSIYLCNLCIKTNQKTQFFIEFQQQVKEMTECIYIDIVDFIHFKKFNKLQ